MSCNHKRIKKNYPFGRKSTADKYCKNCGKIITNQIISNRVKNRVKRR